MPGDFVGAQYAGTIAVGVQPVDAGNRAKPDKSVPDILPSMDPTYYPTPAPSDCSAAHITTPRARWLDCGLMCIASRPEPGR